MKSLCGSLLVPVFVCSAAALDAQSLLRRFDLGPSIRLDGDAFACGEDLDGDGVVDVVCKEHWSSWGISAISGRTGRLIWRLPQGPLVEDIVSLDAGSDVDGDGVPDVLAGSAYGYVVRVYSGVDGSVLLTIPRECPVDTLRFGNVVAFVGDVDADGFPDLGVGALFRDGGERAARDGGGGQPARSCRHDYSEAYVYSGRDGSLLHRLVDPVYRGTLGWALGPAGDADADDFRVDARDQIRVVSGRDGRLLHAIPRSNGKNRLRVFGARIAAPAGDVDGDGHDDLFVHDRRRVQVRSGVDGSVLPWPVSGGGDPRIDAGDVAAVGDVDGDGRADFAVGWPAVDSGAGANSGRTTIYSGASGGALFSVPGSSPDQLFGYRVDAAGDLDGDGRADVLVGATGWRTPSAPDQTGVFAYTLDGSGQASAVRRFGAPCPGSNGNLPRIDVGRRPFVGESFSLELRGAPPSSPALVMVGVRRSTPLDGVGAPGCWLHLQTDAVHVLATTDARGMAATAPLAVPGPAEVVCQWAVFDPRANTLGGVTSDALRCVVRRRLP